MKTCPNCSAKIWNNSKTCKYCWESFVPKTKEELEEERIEQRNEKFKKWFDENEKKLVTISNWVWILLFICSLYFWITVGFWVNWEWWENQAFALKFFLWPIPIFIVMCIILWIIWKYYPIKYWVNDLLWIWIEVISPFYGVWYIWWLISFVLWFLVFKDTSWFWNFFRGLIGLWVVVTFTVIVVKIIKAIFKTTTTQSFWIFIGGFTLLWIIAMYIEAERDEVEYNERKQQLINEIKDMQRDNQEVKEEIWNYYWCDDVDFSEFDTDFRVSSENTMSELEDMREELEEEWDFIARIYDHVERYGCRWLY